MYNPTPDRVGQPCPEGKKLAAMLDTALALLHHLLVFGLVAVLAAELALVNDAMDVPRLRQVANLDLCYGTAAALLLAVGAYRVYFAGKGWDYYAANPFFWLKMLAFLILGLLSIGPTLRILAWRKAEIAAPGTLPDASAVAGVRRLIWAEVAVFPFIPLFAVLMAQGFGG
jgi:putative membrane protein